MTEKVDPKFEGIFDNLWKNERKDEYPTRKSTDPSLGEEQARVEGYEACKEELNKYLYQLESGPPPTFRDYVDGYKDCRNDVLEFIRKMKGDAPPF